MKATKSNRIPPGGSKGNKEQKDTPPEGPKGHKEPKDNPPQGPKWQKGRPKGQNGGREAKMKAQKAKIKGKESVQSQNEENQRPQAQKLENRPGHSADKFFVWDLGPTDRFWQLVGGAHGRRPEVVKDTPLKAQKSHKEQKDTPLKAQKDTKSQRIAPPKGSKCQNGCSKGQNGGRAGKIKAQNAKMKGNEGVQSQNEENQRPQAQKLENRLGYGADKFFVWDLGKTDRFWQLVGGGPTVGGSKL